MHSRKLAPLPRTIANQFVQDFVVLSLIIIGFYSAIIWAIGG